MDRRCQLSRHHAATMYRTLCEAEILQTLRRIIPDRRILPARDLDVAPAAVGALGVRMEHLGKVSLLDETGKPLNDRIERVLCDLLPRFRRQFPSFKDEVFVTEVLEEAGRCIADHERQSGPIEKLHGYAWVTVRNIATSRMRRLSNRLAQKTLAPPQSESALAIAPSLLGSPEEIETDVLLRELLAQLTPHERLVCVWKKAGFSSKEIAKYRGSSVSAIDTIFFRAKQKIRRILGVQESGASCQQRMGQQRGTLVTFPSGDGVDIERADG